MAIFEPVLGFERGLFPSANLDWIESQSHFLNRAEQFLCNRRSRVISCVRFKASLGSGVRFTFAANFRSVGSGANPCKSFIFQLG